MGDPQVRVAGRCGAELAKVHGFPPLNARSPAQIHALSRFWRRRSPCARTSPAPPALPNLWQESRFVRSVHRIDLRVLRVSALFPTCVRNPVLFVGRRCAGPTNKTGFLTHVFWGSAIPDTCFLGEQTFSRKCRDLTARGPPKRSAPNVRPYCDRIHMQTFSENLAPLAARPDYSSADRSARPI